MQCGLAHWRAMMPGSQQGLCHVSGRNPHIARSEHCWNFWAFPHMNFPLHSEGIPCLPAARQWNYFIHFDWNVVLRYVKQEEGLLWNCPSTSILIPPTANPLNFIRKGFIQATVYVSWGTFLWGPQLMVNFGCIDDRRLHLTFLTSWG